MCIDNCASEKISFTGALFDLDGTILDSMVMWRTLLENDLLAKGVYPEPFLSLNIWGENTKFKERYLYEKYGFRFSFSDFSEKDKECIKRFYSEKAEPKPGAVEFLEFLSEKGIKTALATATPLPYMESALKKQGIIDLLDVIITTSDIGVGKSRPDIYNEACSRLGIESSSAVIFEDAHYAVSTAKKAGYKVIAIDDWWQFRKKDEIKSLADRYILNWSEVYELIDL